MPAEHSDPDLSARLSSAENRLLERALDHLAAQLEHERQRADRAEQRETTTAAQAARAEQRADEAIARVERAEERLGELLARQAITDSPPPIADVGPPPERRHWRAGAIVVVLLLICAALVFVTGSR